MKFVFPLVILSLTFSMVACSTFPSNRSTKGTELSAQEQQVLYETFASECTALRQEFEAARIVNRDLGRKWRRVPGSERLSGEGRRHFARSNQISHKFTRIQLDSKKMMQAHKQAIISNLPSYDASICDTEGMTVIFFPPMSTTDLR